MKKVGILTWHYYPNFGSGLQAFALQKLISDLGFDARLINYRNPRFDNTKCWKLLFKKILHNTIGILSKIVSEKTNIGNTARFQETYLRQTKRFTEESQLQQIVKGYYCLVYGSDQIWAPNVYNPIYMGCYAPLGVRKVSYAASIGLNDIQPDLAEVYRKNLSSFTSVAVREDEGQQLLRDKCNVCSLVVLDPTLMVDAAIYRKMLKPVLGVSGKFIFCYFLNKEHAYRARVEEYARRRNLRIIGCSDRLKDAEWMTLLNNLGADQFLWLVENSEVIFTDSYHGSIFSLLFHKNFWTFVRFSEDSPICQNSRIRQLQKYFEIGHRIVSPTSNINDENLIFYDLFEARLAKLREKSMEYIKNALT